MNPEVSMTLDEAVEEVLGFLTGLDLQHDPRLDRYRTVVRQLNAALSINALDHEWSYYSSHEEIGVAHAGDRDYAMRASVRPRIINDDSVRLVDDNGNTKVWAYWLPRDANHKYVDRPGLWATHTRQTLSFSRPLHGGEEGLHIMVPVMREPKKLILPAKGEAVPDEIREQLIDFDYPRLIALKAAYLIAQADPVMQPRVQTIESQMKDLMYGLIERDTRQTAHVFLNDFAVPITNSIYGRGSGWQGRHPHSDERR